MLYGAAGGLFGDFQGAGGGGDFGLFRGVVVVLVFYVFWERGVGGGAVVDSERSCGGVVFVVIVSSL